jgi:hypothetical protein
MKHLNKENTRIFFNALMNDDREAFINELRELKVGIAEAKTWITSHVEKQPFLVLFEMCCKGRFDYELCPHCGKVHCTQNFTREECEECEWLAIHGD